MWKRNLMVGTCALLLAGFTATAADAGEARGARGKVVVEDEDGRQAPRQPSARTPATRPPVVPTRRPAPREETLRPNRPAPRGEVAHPRRPVPREEVVRPQRPAPRGEVAQPQRPAPRGEVVRPHRPAPPVTRRPEPGRLHPHPVVHRPALRWVPGRYEERVRQVWVPGYYRTERVPARYESRRGLFGFVWRIMVRPERTRKVWVSGHYRPEREQVWVPGYWIRAPQPAGRYR